MGVGKRPIVVPAGYDGNVEATLKSLVAALNVLRSELAVTPGIGELIAGEDIDATKAVRILGNQLFLADAATNKPAVGVSISKAVTGSKCRYILGYGYGTVFSGLTPASSVYLGNAGALVYAIPGAGMKQGIGYAFSATEMMVTVGTPF